MITLQDCANVVGYVTGEPIWDAIQLYSVILDDDLGYYFPSEEDVSLNISDWDPLPFEEAEEQLALALAELV